MVAVRKLCLLLASLCLALPVGSASRAQRALADAARPEITLAHYNHRAWRMVDGAPPDIWALAQAHDGFLWLGTGSGIYRFDGMVFEEVLPRSGQFPSSNATALFITSDGTTWIGYFTGEISRLTSGRLQNFDHPDSSVEQFAQGRDGTIWAARRGPRGGLFAFDGERWSRVGGRDGIRDRMAYSVIAARDGAMWVATEKNILVRRPGGRRFEVVGNNMGVARLAQAPSGQVWVSGAVSPSPANHGLAIVPGSSARAERADRMIFSRDGALWQTTFGGGVTRIGGLSRPGMYPLIERFTTEGGLTSPVAVPLLQDREGNIWIGTNLGLNRLRPVSAVTALAVASGLTRTFALAATSDGTVYVANAQKLYRALSGGALELFRTLPRTIEFVEADGKDLIVGQGRSILRLTKERENRIDIPPPPGEIASWSSQAGGDTWITAKETGVFRLTSSGWRAADVVAQGAARNFVFSHIRTSSGDWLYAQNLLLRRNGRLFERVGSQGPDLGHITLISEGSAGLLVGGELGLARLQGEHFQTVGIAREPMLRGISGIVQTPSCEVWINGVRGLLRTTCIDLEAAFADPTEPLRYQRFSAADGLPGGAQQNGFGSTLARGGDGRIWIANNLGIGWIDSARLITNRLPPPVKIRSVEANGHKFADVERVDLPAGTENLRIGFTALSLAASEMLRFRYQLVGVDSDWVDAGARREAFYANLPPGEWRFKVIAANNDGIWNTQGDSLTISIAPRFYQTSWFRMLCVCLLLSIAWVIYNWRVREHRRRERDRAEVQLAERERIARELHDTLLQGVQGLMLRFQAVANAMTPGSREHTLAEKALERADDLVIQARDRVRDLRARDRPVEFLALVQELAEHYRRDGLNISLIGDGHVDLIDPEMVEQLLPIVAEALANTLLHAKASEVVISVRRTGTHLQLSITDNGIGFPVEVITTRGRPGHFGIRGMCERAYALGGVLCIKNSADGGAHIELHVPPAD